MAPRSARSTKLPEAPGPEQEAQLLGGFVLVGEALGSWYGLLPCPIPGLAGRVDQEQTAELRRTPLPKTASATVRVGRRLRTAVAAVLARRVSSMASMASELSRCSMCPNSGPLEA